MKKFKRCPFRRPCTQSTKRSKRDTTRFPADTTGHGLRITKPPAVWYFSIFLFEKSNFYWKIFHLYLESSGASRKWKNSKVVLFADFVHRVRRQNTVNYKMTNGECMYCKTVDYVSWMALEKDDFRRFSVIWEFRVTGNWVEARVASRVKMGL